MSRAVAIPLPTGLMMTLEVTGVEQRLALGAQKGTVFVRGHRLLRAQLSTL